MNYKILKEETLEGTCLECGTGLCGRKDKKFCSLSCKNTYNNRRHQILRKYRGDIIAKLSRNYEILESMLSDDWQSANLEDLEKLGFDDSVFTSQSWKRKRGHEQRSCFDIVYSHSESKIYDLYRKL